MTSKYAGPCSAASMSVVLALWATPVRAQLLPYTGAPLSPAIIAGGAPADASGEVWVGPLPDWINVKTLGAPNDCSSDAAPAIQSAFNRVATVNNDGSVNNPTIYIPQGCYSLRTPLTLRYRSGVRVTGDGIGATRLRWDGPPHATMIHVTGVNFDQWQRLTIDGNNGRADYGLLLDWDSGLPGSNNPADVFPSPHEISDVAFSNIALNCLQGGNRQQPGVQNSAAPEAVVIRDEFRGCGQVAVFTDDPNTLNWAIRDSYFQGNNAGIGGFTDSITGFGGFQAYDNVFVGSTEADILWLPFVQTSLRGNWSQGSPHFVLSPFEAVFADLLLQGNTVVGATDNPVKLFPSGPYTLLDNVLATAPSLGKQPAVLVDSPLGGAPQFLAVGNTFTSSQWLFNYDPTVGVRVRQQENRVVPPASLPQVAPPLPAHVAPATAAVITVTARTGAAIQAAIQQAQTSTATPPPIVLLQPAATTDDAYRVDHTIEVPANLPIRIMGAGRTNTRVIWVGPAGGNVFHFAGPSRAVLSDVSISAAPNPQTPYSNGILIDHADQPGSRILVDSILFHQGNNEVLGLLFDGLDNTFMQVTDTLGGNVSVVGGPLSAAGQFTTGRVNILGQDFGGATQSDVPGYQVSHGGRLLAADEWYESNTPPPGPLFNLTDGGFFTLETQLSAALPLPAGNNFTITGFSGQATLLDSPLNEASLNIQGGLSTAVLVAGWVEGNPNNNRSHIRVTGDAGLVSGVGNVLVDSTGAGHLAPGIGPAPRLDSTGAASLHAALAQARLDGIYHWGPLPAGLTDVRLIRLNIDLYNTALHVTP